MTTRWLALVVLVVNLTVGPSSSIRAAQQDSKTQQGAAAQSASKRDYARRIKMRGVPGFAQVGPNLYRGNQPSAEGFKSLADMGIQIIVDLRLSRKGSERKRVTGLGMEYVSLPWFCMLPRDATFAKFLQLVRDNPDKKIFVHCRTGDDRVGMTIAAYRMAEQGWTAKEADQEMHAMGADWLHRRICIGLDHYEKTFPRRFENNEAFAQIRGEQAAPASAAADPPAGR